MHRSTRRPKLEIALALGTAATYALAIFLTFQRLDILRWPFLDFFAEFDRMPSMPWFSELVFFYLPASMTAYVLISVMLGISFFMATLVARRTEHWTIGILFVVVFLLFREGIDLAHAAVVTPLNSRLVSDPGPEYEAYFERNAIGENIVVGTFAIFSLFIARSLWVRVRRQR
jgi:hypothetical protein